MTENIKDFPKKDPGNVLPPTGAPLKLRLGTIGATKRTVARLLKAYQTGTVAESMYRGLLWGIQIYSGVLRLDSEQDLAERVIALEKALTIDKRRKVS